MTMSITLPFARTKPHHADIYAVKLAEIRKRYEYASKMKDDSGVVWYGKRAMQDVGELLTIINRIA